MIILDLDQPIYKVLIRDKDFKFIGEVDQWVSLDVNLFFNNLGKWSIELNYESDAAKLFLSILSDPHNGGKGGIYIERNGYFLLSGPIQEAEMGRNENGYFLRISGTCDLQWITDHLASPHPRYFNMPYMTVDGTTARGHADYVPNYAEPRSAYASWHIHTLVRTNIGESAPAQRPPLPFLTTRDNSVGYVIPAGEYTIARGENLFALCKNIADYSDYMGHPIRMSAKMYDTGTKHPDGSPLMKVRFECIPSEKRPNVVFSSDLGTISNYTYIRRRPEANAILMAGSGEGSARRFAFDYDPASISMYGRIEAFEEYTGHQNDDQNSHWPQERAKLIQEIRSILAEKAEQTIFTFDFHESPTVQYGRDFVIGDQVQIQVEGKSTMEVIREVSFSVSQQEKISLIAGSQSYISKGLRLFDDIKNLKYRYSNLNKRTLGQ